MFRHCYLLTVGGAVFLAGLAFYLLTAAWMPYPGVSSQVLAAYCFPGQAPCLGVHPLDDVVMGGLVRLLPQARMIQGTTIFSAVLGALTVLGLFRVVWLANQVFTADAFQANRQDARLMADLVHIRWLSGLGAALVGLVAVPLWAQGTRPLSGTVSTALCVLLLLMVLRFLRGVLLSPSVKGGSAAGHWGLFCGSFALAAFLGSASPQLFLVVSFCLFLACKVLVLPDTEHRARYVIAAGISLGVGFAAACLAFIGWQALFAPDSTLPFWQAWVERLIQAWSAAPALIRTFEQSAPLVYFMVEAALFLGCFPRAFQRIGAPLIGQVAIGALTVLPFIPWPQGFWETQAEPSLLGTMGAFLSVANAALLVASWQVAWSESRYSANARKVRTGVLCAGVLGLGVLAVGECARFSAEGAGWTARRDFREPLDILSRLVAPKYTVWEDPPEGSEPLLLTAYEQGRHVWPLRNWKHFPDALYLGSQPFAACRAADPVLACLANLDDASRRDYLRYSRWRAAFSKDPIPAAKADDIAHAAAQIQAAAFGKTASARRFTEAWLGQAARLAAIQAFAAPAAQAAEQLRKARRWAPENVGVCLSLVSLKSEGVALSHEERLAAMQAEEREPWIVQPTYDRVEAFERDDGPVRSQVFRAANRLRCLIQEDQQTLLQQICAAYRETPALLSIAERQIALLALPEAEAGALLLNGSPQEQELELYLCAYPWSETSLELYRRHAEILAGNSALAALYAPGRKTLRTFLAERALAFFTRDGRFPYALFHVETLLRSGKLAEAVRFVSSFTFSERLASQPYFAEFLRWKVASAALASGETKTVESMRQTLRAWVLAIPEQAALWHLLLTAPEPDAALRAKDLHHCMAVFPFHPAAVPRFAETLRAQAGAEAAAAWQQAAARFRAALRKSPYAHR